LGLVDNAIHIPDEDTIHMVFHLLQKDGIFVGASSALNIVTAMKVAEKLPENSNVVTILCDGAYRYQSRLFSKSWLQSKNLWNKIGEGKSSVCLD